MLRKKPANNPPCPHCQGKQVTKNGHKDRLQRWRCHLCGRSFGPTHGTPMYRLRTSAVEVARSLRVVMRRGSLSAAEELTGHKYETIGRWLRLAFHQVEAITHALVQELGLTAVEVDAFWSFVKKSVQRLEGRGAKRPGWARVGDV